MAWTALEEESSDWATTDEESSDWATASVEPASDEPVSSARATKGTCTHRARVSVSTTIDIMRRGFKLLIEEPPRETHDKYTNLLITYLEILEVHFDSKRWIIF